VLAKLLLHGDGLDKDLWDTKTNSLKLSELNCNFMPYLQLIELCLSPAAKIGEILDLVEAISHDPQLPIPVEIILPKLLEDLPKGNDDLRVAAAKTLGELVIMDQKVEATIIAALSEALNDPDVWVKRHAIKSLGLLLKKSNILSINEVVATVIKMLEDKEKSRKS